MSEQPLVSVIVPIYNGAESIQKTLASILAQTYRNIEVICVNDGSSDTTLDILQTLSSEDARIRIISTVNQGAYLARETGMRAASGVYVSFCDADDAMEPAMLETMVTRAESDQADMVVCAYRRQSDESAHAEMTGFGNDTLIADENSGWLCSINTALWNKLYRRSVLNQRLVLDNPPRVMEDALLLFSIFPYLSKVSFISKPLYLYRDREGSTMKQLSADELSELTAAWATLKTHIADTNPSYLRIIDLGAFVHLGVSASFMLASSHAENFGQAYSHISGVLQNDFPLSRKSPFTTSSFVKQYPTMAMTRYAALLYQAGLMRPALRAYSALSKHLNLARW